MELCGQIFVKNVTVEFGVELCGQEGLWKAYRRQREGCCGDELHIDGMREDDVLVEICKQTRAAIPPEDLDLVAVTTGNQDKTPVRRNSKIPRMKPRLLITNPRKQTRLGIHIHKPRRSRQVQSGHI